MQIIEASNPVYADENHVSILLDVKFDELGEEMVRFLAKADDIEPHGVNLFCRAMVGEFGPITPYQKQIPVTLPLSNIKADLISQLEQELFKRMPAFAAFKRGVDAINAASTKEEARMALANVEWPDGVTGQWRQS